MFRCGHCGSTDFNLVMQPGQQIDVSIRITAEEDVLVTVGSKTFVADLPFMNRYAVCQCEAVRKWTYYYPKRSVLAGRR